MEKLFRQQAELGHPYAKTAISYTNAESLFIPAEHFNNEDVSFHLDSIFGKDGSSRIITEFIPVNNLYNIFRVPDHLYDMPAWKFNAARYMHNYAVQLKNFPDEKGDTLFVEFRTDEFAVMVLKHGKLHLAQTFAYSAPGDVLYYLLKICSQFSLSQQEVGLVISGLIEKESAIYRELYKYFLHPGFEKIPGNIQLAGGFSEYPVHYFSSICKLAICVL